MTNKYTKSYQKKNLNQIQLLIIDHNWSLSAKIFIIDQNQPKDHNNWQKNYLTFDQIIDLTVALKDFFGNKIYLTIALTKFFSEELTWQLVWRKILVAQLTWQLPWQTFWKNNWLDNCLDLKISLTPMPSPGH